jgi:hypothetical protein
MSKPRVTTDEQDKALADWWWALKGMGTVRDKAKEHGISVSALYDAIARGLQKPTAGQRFKVREYATNDTPGVLVTWADVTGLPKPEHEWREDVPRESNQCESNLATKDVA